MGDSDPLIAVTLDDRETRGPVPAALAASGWFDIAVERLSVGDYLVDRRFLFERKTLRDLEVSIASGRLFAQALRLAEVRDHQPVLLLEGRAIDLRGTNMRREAVQGALVTVSLFVGLPILRSRTPGETARLFRYAAMQGRSVARGAIRRGGRRPRGKAAVQHHLLQGLPGVGPARAARLLDRFGSVQSIVNAGRDELSSVEAIGPKTAELIAWSVREPTSGYRAEQSSTASGLISPDSSTPNGWLPRGPFGDGASA